MRRTCSVFLSVLVRRMACIPPARFGPMPIRFFFFSFGGCIDLGFFRCSGVQLTFSLRIHPFLSFLSSFLPFPIVFSVQDTVRYRREARKLNRIEALWGQLPSHSSGTLAPARARRPLALAHTFQSRCVRQGRFRCSCSSCKICSSPGSGVVTC